MNYDILINNILFFSLQVFQIGGNELTQVPEELGQLSQLSALALCDNNLKKLPRAISRLTNLRSLLLHKNNLCCLPVEIVKLGSLSEVIFYSKKFIGNIESLFPFFR